MIEKSRLRSTKINCAIYTRKSTEEGLEQEFNSLDAQRESCEAYILSMKHEGWTLFPHRYDDGGFSGGNLQRPALQRLLHDIRNENIDIIVVYKIDRLTRSLLDFGKIFEIIDSAGASFVSVTQSFNTSNSMGRLTLNMLLSFAQFEREVGSERVRDKIAASKAKGMWTGGSVPYGYDLIDHSLIVNPQEAEHVRFIMETYVSVKSVRALMGILKDRGITRKRLRQHDGGIRCGLAFSKGMLYHLLRNQVYIGLTKHNEATYPGRHERIVDDGLWQKVQETFAQNSAVRRYGANARAPSILAGFIWGARGQRMGATHTQKKNKRYRYYVDLSNAAADQPLAHVPRRVSAEQLEALVQARLADLLRDQAFWVERWRDEGCSAHAMSVRLSQFSSLSAKVDGATKSQLRYLIIAMCRRVEVWDEKIDLHVSVSGIMALAGCVDNESTATEFIVSIGCDSRRSARGSLIILPDSADKKFIVDKTLVRLLARAHAARHLLENGIEVMAGRRFRSTYLTKLARYTYLAPTIVTAILDGSQPKELTASRLRRLANLPMDWEAQKLLLGFGAAEPATAK